MPTPHDTATYAGTVAFTAKLPDDISVDEFAGLVEAVAVLDAAAVAYVRDSPEAEILTPDLKTVEPSVVRKVQYGSDFEVILGIVGQTAGAVGIVAATFISMAKALSLLADAGLKNEDRLGKRDERLRRRQDRVLAQQQLGMNRVYFNLGLFFAEEGYISADTEVDSRRAKQADEALETLVPSAGRGQVEQALPSELQGREVRVALSQLAEYGVEIRVTQPEAPTATK